MAELPELRMVLVLCTEGRLGEVERLLAAHGVEGYTELPGLHGAGSTGRRLGTRAFPGSVSMLFTVGPAEAMEQLLGALREMAARCSPEEGLRAFELPVVAVV